MVFKLAWITSLLVWMAQPAWAQLTLRGQVLNGANQQPLALANVFLSGTTKATITSQTGSFTLVNVPLGAFELVVSYIGFETLKIRINTQGQPFHRLLLKPGELPLDAVTVKARRRKGLGWAGHVALFKEHFIGTSRNARRCRLLNPQVLSFSHTPQQLRATAGESLLIDNQALGYRVTMQLDYFTYDYTSAVATYQGNATFEPLPPRNQREAHRWQQSRQRAYQGSMMHFGRALYSRRLVEEGFTVQRVTLSTDSSETSTWIRLPGDTLVAVRSLANPKQFISLPVTSYEQFIDPLRSTSRQLVLAFSNLLQVAYTKESEPYEYQRLLKPDYEVIFQTSRLRLQTPGVTLGANGQFWPADGLLSEGYWSWELLADDLPFDYDPNEQLIQP